MENDKSSMKKILIADDSVIFRDRLKRIISETYDMHVVAEANLGDEALDMVTKKDFDLVILDIELREKNGLDILKEIKDRRPDLSVLMLSMFPEEQYRASVLKAGADGYVTKETVPDELLHAIRQVMHGEKYFRPINAEEF